MKKFFLTLLITGSIFYVSDAQPPELLFLDPDLSIEERARDLVSRMTLQEKVNQLNYDAPAIPRLMVPEYNWWSEALHGVARNGRATVFPQAIGLAATFDPDLIKQVATVISDEARAKFNASQQIGNTGQYAGLTFWSPNVNTFRDPRWGRGQETYGEDPYLSSRIGVSFVIGLQGDHPEYLKAAACAKHYVVHSGPEGDRHTFNATPPRKDFRETYLAPFRALVQEADVEIVMCAYNRTYDKPCCGSSFLLQDILRNEWGFDGHVTSDCWALVDIHENHKYTDTPAESAALAFKSGVNVNCGSISPYLMEAFEKDLITEEEIDETLITLMKTRFRLGLFDPVYMNPYNTISPDILNQPQHQLLALKAAEKSIVLLKNDNALPLDRSIEHLYVYGPNATNGDVLLGNYFGVTGNMVTILEGIAAEVHPGTKLEYRHAFLLSMENVNPIDWTTGGAAEADAIIVAMGLSGMLEGEEGESLLSPTKSDRFDIRLPENQINYLKKLRAAGDAKIIVVLTGGSPVAIPEVHELADAIIYAWYPGEQGGTAIANILFGDVNPSGRLPLTFPKSTEQLPPYEDYSMEGRTYRYMEDEPQYPFGFGLNYTKFTYSDLLVDDQQIDKGENVEITFTITNSGKVAGDEVAQLYLTDLEASTRTPRYALKGIERIHLVPGESKIVKFTVPPEAMKLVLDDGTSVIEPGEFMITIGGASPGQRSLDLGSPEFISTTFTVR